jgi:hypothetical protein
MPNIQHSAITDPNIHEPKGITTASNRQVYKAHGSGSGGWARLTEADLDFSSASNNLFGWNDIHDSLYTSGSPRAISSGSRTQLTNNALDASTDVTRLGAIWSTVNNNFLINDLNALYIIRVLPLLLLRVHLIFVYLNCKALLVPLLLLVKQCLLKVVVMSIKCHFLLSFQ